MSTQAEALRLADELDAVPETGADPDLIQESAAELRRLAVVEALRDALLEALKDATKTIEHLGYPLAAIERARAAIKAVEETK